MNLMARSWRAVLILSLLVPQAFAANTKGPLEPGLPEAPGRLAPSAAPEIPSLPSSEALQGPAAPEAQAVPGAAGEQAAAAQPDAAAFEPQVRFLQAFEHALKKDGRTEPGTASRASARRFDGAKPATEEAGVDGAVEPETVPSGFAEEQPEVRELWFGRDSAKGLVKSEVYAQIKPIKNTRGSRWYWENFKKGSSVRVIQGGALFLTKVTAAYSKPIGKLTREDFEGVYPAAAIKGKTADALRKKLVADLQAAHQRGMKYRAQAPLVLTGSSEVRVVRIMPFKEARVLPENGVEEAPAPIERKELDLAPALRAVRHNLPKAVFIDLRDYPEGLPYELHEDMTKLMKAGVYFVVFSDKKIEGPGSVKEQMEKGLTEKQRGAVTRYKLVVVGEDGNAMSGYKGSFPKYLPVRRFDNKDLEIMDFAAKALGGETLSLRGGEIRVAVPEGQDAGEFAAKLEAQLKSLHAPAEGYQKTFGLVGGRTILILRPQSLVSAIPAVLENLRDHEGLFVNNSDLMVISRDEALLGALAGSVQPAKLMPQLKGTDLVDASLGSMLGDYRVNQPGDFAASASKIGAFKQGRTASGGDFYNIYMLTGHVMHSAFNWALWRYRNEGKMPETEAVVERARQNWIREDQDRVKNLLDEAGATMGDAQLAMEVRMRNMYAMLQDLVSRYPIMVGTEMPNLYYFDRYKKGQFANRDILRLIFDGVLARKTRKGLEIMLIDFKTGQTSTNQTFDKDTQVQLYDTVIRLMWDHLSVPYGAMGDAQKVIGAGITFIYPSEMKEAQINEWGRLKFEKTLKGQMGKMRKALLPPAEEKAKPAKGKATSKKEAKEIKLDKSRAKDAGFDTLELPRTVPGIKIKKVFAQQIVKGTKKIEYRTTSSQPKPFVAIIQTFTDEEPGRAAEVVAFARIEKVTHNGSEYEYHLTHVTPVEPYVVPKSVNKPGIVIWVKDVPVQGPKKLAGK